MRFRTIPWSCGENVWPEYGMLWPGFGLILDNSGAGSGAVLCPGGGMFVWLVMTVCVDCFVGISYATIGLENQVVFACFLFTYLVIVIYNCP